MHALIAGHAWWDKTNCPAEMSSLTHWHRRPSPLTEFCLQSKQCQAHYVLSVCQVLHVPGCLFPIASVIPSAEQHHVLV